MISSDENIPYRSAIPDVMADDTTTTTEDEANYNTLIIVRNTFQTSVNNLYKDFNAFTLNKNKLPADRAKLLLHDIEVKQGVYDVLAPLLESVISAVQTVDDKYKQ